MRNPSHSRIIKLKEKYASMYAIIMYTIFPQVTFSCQPPYTKSRDMNTTMVKWEDAIVAVANKQSSDSPRGTYPEHQHYAAIWSESTLEYISYQQTGIWHFQRPCGH